MYKIIKFFAEHDKLAYLITIAILMLGLATLRTVKRDQFPPVDMGIMNIITRYPGASPEDVELNVTNKLEDELRDVDGLEEMTSFSMENISWIDLIIDGDVSDPEEVKRDVRDAIARATDFPPEVTDAPLVVEWVTSDMPVLEVGLAGEVPYSELREHAKRFEKKLKDIPGVSRLERFGYRAREIKVEVVPAAIDRYQIPVRQIVAAIQADNIRATAGSFESYTSEQSIVTLAQFDDPMAVGDVIVRASFEGPRIRVRDLAVIRDDFEPEKVRSRLDGSAAISFLVHKKESADVIRLVDTIKEFIAEEQSRLPEGVELRTAMDGSLHVRSTFGVVGRNGLMGLGLVLITLVLFLNFRSAFWVAMGIPVAGLGVIFCMAQLGYYLETPSLIAMIIVVGIIVDDGIVVAENIERHREHGKTPLQAAIDGTHEVFAPVVTTVITTILAFAPLLFMEGMLGKFIFVMPMVITLALIISLIESTLALPAHIAGARGGESKRSLKESAWFRRLRDRFRKFVLVILKLRYIVVLLFAAAFVGALWYASNYMHFVLFPTQSAKEFWVVIETPVGSSLNATTDKVMEVEAIIAQLPDDELDSYATRIGVIEQLPGESEDRATVRVNLTPYTERDRTANEIVEGLREPLSTLEDVDIRFDVQTGGPPVGKPITMRVVGADDAMRVALTDSLMAYLQSVEGVKDLARDDRDGKQEVIIRPNRGKMAELGITVADVAQNVRLAYDGQIVTTVRYGDEDVGFRVQLEEQYRSSPGVLRRLPIPNRQGRLIPLRQVARFTEGPGPANLYHYEGERTITVSGDVVVGVLTALQVVELVNERFNIDRDWPGLRLVIGGEAEKTQEMVTSLLIAFSMAAVGVYFVLILLFNSLTRPILVMLAIPFGLVGVIVTFALHSEPMGFMAMLGVIGLSGVVVNDSLLLVNFVLHLQSTRPDTAFLRHVAEGSATRLRPILVTSISTVAGLLPLAYGLGGADQFGSTMALAMGYGILFATPLTLILLPCFLMIHNDIGRVGGRIRFAFSRNRAVD
jgi:multidrug efflux pump subunit AcrB